MCHRRHISKKKPTRALNTTTRVNLLNSMAQQRKAGPEQPQEVAKASRRTHNRGASPDPVSAKTKNGPANCRLGAWPPGTASTTNSQFQGPAWHDAAAKLRGLRGLRLRRMGDDSVRDMPVMAMC